MLPSMILKAQKMAFGSECVAKTHEGMTVLVSGAVPGETLEAEIYEEKKDFCRARAVKILEESPHRVEPPCPCYGICGGCTMQHIDGQFQRELRSQILAEAFLRNGIQIPKIEALSGPDYGYRARFQFHDGGLLSRQSNSVVQIEDCPVADKRISEWLRSVPPSERPKGKLFVFAGDELVTAQAEQRNPEPRIIGGARRKVRAKRNRHFSGTAQGSASRCSATINGRKIFFDALGFFQSNLEVLSKAVSALTEGLCGSHALDIYGGAGTFSVFLAERFAHVSLVEHNRDTVVFAEENLAGKSRSCFGMTGAQFVKSHAEAATRSFGSFDAVVLDPPRSGMERPVLEWLCTRPAPQIRSVSCDPATHARDAAALVRAGYSLTRLFLLDFYPQTGHIESLAFFEDAR